MSSQFGVWKRIACCRARIDSDSFHQHQDILWDVMRDFKLLHLYSAYSKYIEPTYDLRAIQSHEGSSSCAEARCQVDLPGHIRNAKLCGSWRYPSLLRRFYRQRWAAGSRRTAWPSQTVVECLRWLYGSWLSLEITLWGLPGVDRVIGRIVREPITALRPIFQKDNSGANGTSAHRPGSRSDKPSKAARLSQGRIIVALLSLLSLSSFTGHANER